MGKKTLRKSIDDYNNAGVFKWEFLRRNKSFKLALQNHIKKKKSLLATLNKNAKGLNIRPEDLQASVTADWLFTKKWGLSMAGDYNWPDPAKAFGELTEFQRHQIQEPSTLPIEHFRWLLANREPALIKKDSWQGRLFDNGSLDISISQLRLDIDLRKPEQQIMTELKQIIKLLKDFRKTLYPKKSVRQRFEDYQFYLKVYDLKEEGLSWLQIYERIYPNSSHLVKAHGKASMVQKVKRAYDRCKKLIEDEYKDIC